MTRNYRKVSQKSTVANNISHFFVRAVVQDIGRSTEIVFKNGQTQYRIIAQ